MAHRHAASIITVVLPLREGTEKKRPYTVHCSKYYVAIVVIAVVVLSLWEKRNLPFPETEGQRTDSQANVCIGHWLTSATHLINFFFLSFVLFLSPLYASSAVCVSQDAKSAQ